MTKRNISLTLLVLNLLAIQTQAGWIDPDTPQEAHHTRPLPVPGKRINKWDYWHNYHPDKLENNVDPTGSPTGIPTASPTESPSYSPSHVNDKTRFNLVMSDEFNIEGRSFKDGDDPKWTALNKNDYTNGALHYYSENNVVTRDGDLVIKSEAKDIDYVGMNTTTLEDAVFTKHFKSAMLQSWNKFCFTGGIVEAEIQLPGKHDVSGLWPAFWLLGNLARHTYVGSTNHVWPWSSNECTEKASHAQRINGCLKAQHFDMQSGVGRGAPEIDIFEVQAGPTPRNTGPFLESSVGQPFMSNSFQVAPGRAHNRPGNNYWPGPGQWYEGLHGGENTNLNIYFYGDYNHFKNDPEIKDYWSDAISYNGQLDESHFATKYRYRVEWILPDEEEGTDGYIRWFVNDKFVLEIDGKGIVDAGYNSTISTEPMYLILNTAISKNWGFSKKCPANCSCRAYNCNSEKFQDFCAFPYGFCDMMSNKTDLPEYKVNWVRVYQDPNNPKHKVGCSTPERPTKKYIEANADLYKTSRDEKPLKDIQLGKGACTFGKDGGSPASNCGGTTRGVCTPGRVCQCRGGWTGPHCLVPAGFNPVDYDRAEGIHDLKFTGPNWNLKGIWLTLTSLAVVFLFFPTIGRRMDGWKPIPDAQL